jgi:hypothetical protein
MRPYHIFLIIPALCVSLVGCTHYEYDILRPPEFARHIGTKADEIFQRDPLEYRLITVDNHLVMRIFNMTDDAITLLGQRSSVVDPNGQSHPLPTQTMAAHSFVKLIFPPLRPHVERLGPSIGIGIGGVYGSAHRHYSAWGFTDDYYDFDEPRYLTVYDDNSSIYWDWNGEGEMRVMLVFERADQTFEHEFVIARKKM